MAEVITFGCRLNHYESELIKKKVAENNLKGEVFIFNSCSVTAEAEKDVIKKIQKTKKEHPDAKILVTGCAVQINPATFAEMKEVDLVFGNKEKMEDATYKTIKENNFTFTSPNINIEQKTKHEDKLFFEARKDLFITESEKILVNDIASINETSFGVENVVTDFELHTRAFVQIQNGCNHRCTFCIIPFARGNSRSVPFGVISNEVGKLVANGYKEVVLTGVDITDYGKDVLEGLTLGGMVKRLLKLHPTLARLRLSSIDVAEVDESIYDLIQNEERFMPYFHISLQSGDDLILKRMKRRHTRGDVLQFVEKVRKLRSDVAFGADIISGFPTEGDAEFLNSKNLITEAGISFCHIFSFSPHNGTPASKMPQVEKHIIKERTNILIKTGKEELLKTLNSMISKKYSVLLEGNGNLRCEDFVQGKVEENFLTKIDAKRGDILNLTAKSVKNEKIIFE